MTVHTDVTEEPCQHAGWHVFTFKAFGYTWRLTTIERPEERRSILSSDGDRHSPWPDFQLLALSGILTVEMAVDILQRAFGLYEAGIAEGSRKRAAEIRTALGIR